MKKLYLIFLLVGVTLVSCNQNEENKQQTLKQTINKDSIALGDTLPKENIDFSKEHTNLSNTNTGKVSADSAKKTPVLCECFLLDSVQVQLYDTIQGEVIGAIKNDSVAEDYYIVQTLQQQGEWVKINAFVLNTDNKEILGWVKLQKNYFGVYWPNDASLPFNIYSKPDEKSNTIFTCPAYSPTYLLKIVDWNKNWLKVQINTIWKKKTSTHWIKITVNNITGWVKKEGTCPNPYTTCN